MLNLNQEINRIGTSSVKWEYVFKNEEFTFGDHAHKKHGANRILPMWVADMDFPPPQAVTEAIQARAQHEILGYTAPAESYYEAVIDWMQRRHGWTIQRDWIEVTPGIIPALNFAVRTYTAPGDKILIQRPVYYPFMSAIEKNNREIVSNSLRYEQGRYCIDFADLAEKAADPAVKMMILCSPHNPVGRVWSAAELKRIGDICLENNVLVVSDEIHSDLIHSGHTFTPYANLGEEYAQNSIICTAASKTFNLAGLATSNIIIPNETLRTQFGETLESLGLYFPNIFGIIATEAAYRHGEAWLAEVMAYIEGNTRFMKEYVAEHIPQIKLIEPEGTYLVWADCSALGLDGTTRDAVLFDEAKVYLDAGSMFGPEGEDFERFNLACPQVILAEALARVKNVVVA